MQHRVEKLKARLEDLDRRQHEEDPFLLTSIEEDIKEENGERDKLIKELGEALKEHGKFYNIDPAVIVSIVFQLGKKRVPTD